MIEAVKVSKEYRMGAVTLQVLKDVSLVIKPGDFVAITGPSGAGKSTLLHLLAGLDTPTKGDVRWEGASVSRLSDAKRARFRNRKVGIVFQFYHLMPELSAVENVMLPGLIGGQARRQVKERAAACLSQVGLKARQRHRPRELSGGEQQRVAIARALVNEPAVLFADEPTGNLDSKTGEGIIELLTALPTRHGTGLVLVTHDERLAGKAKYVITLQDGRKVSG
ncbi:MAG: ABC transporter ATP-binding protein [Candidatus Omnitrophica bacterium]|nr:ABC transporter ATP-binding protein [Candidatus Omnitrophota bacterium]